MSPYPNLINDSILINRTIELLESNGGFASAENVIDHVMNISLPEPLFAKTLVKDLVENDPRLALNGDTVELTTTDFDNPNLAESDFVVFDFETTGAKAPPCRVTEIGAYRVKNREITGEYQTLVNPGIPIPPFISELTNITDEMVKPAPRFAEVLPEFMDFIGSSVLVAHNAVFDMHFLNHEINRIHPHHRVANPYLCTVRLSRKLLPDLDNHRLKTVADFYSIDLTNHHRAAADALATAKVFIDLLEKLEEKGVTDFEGARKGKF